MSKYRSDIENYISSEDRFFVWVLEARYSWSSTYTFVDITIDKSMYNIVSFCSSNCSNCS